jgi:hypothetical protein
MGYIIGVSADYNTWCRLRAAFGPSTAPGGSLISNTEYYSSSYSAPDKAFMSASPGSGLIRVDAVKTFLRRTANFWIRSTNEQPNPSPPPDYSYDWICQLSWQGTVDGVYGTLVTPEIQEELLGETVECTNASFEITSDLFDNENGIQTFLEDSIVDVGYAVSVGKLTPIP